MKSFAKLLSMHGVRLMTGDGTSSYGRIVSLLYFCFCSGFCSWQVARVFGSYLKFTAKTSVSVADFELIMFPAITICPTTIFLRSTMGRNPLFYIGTYMSVFGYQQSKASQIAEQMCGDSEASNETISLGEIDLFKWTILDSFKAVVQCRYNRQKFNCSRSFLTKQTEMGYCFSFNLGADLLRRFKVVENYPIGADAYGTTANETKTFPIRSGLYNSVSFLMDARSTDYCIPMTDFSGFLAFVHDRDAQPYMSAKRLVSLPPGYSTNVAITVEKIERNTESLGKCESQLQLKWYPLMTEYTTRDSYVLNCLTNIVFENCGCLPYFAPNEARFVKIMNSSGCSVGQLSGQCMTTVTDSEYLNERSCFKNIPIPCKELRIVSTSVSTIFPSHSMLSSLKRSIPLAANMTKSEFRQNYLEVNFYNKVRKMKLIVENPEMTWVDLLNQSGGAIGMCLGMSLISVVEVALFLPPTVTGIILTQLKRKSFRRFAYAN